MAISMELIDEFRKRTNCSYEEAKMLLEKHNGNLLDAIVEFERKNRPGSQGENYVETSNFGAKIKELVKKGFKTRFIMEKSGETIINVSVNILILAAIILNWILLLALVVSFILGYRFRIQKQKGESIDINKMINGLGSKVKESTSGSRGQTQKDNMNCKKDDNDSSGYNEMTVE